MMFGSPAATRTKGRKKRRGDAETGKEGSVEVP